MVYSNTSCPSILGYIYRLVLLISVLAFPLKSSIIRSIRLRLVCSSLARPQMDVF